MHQLLPFLTTWGSSVKSSVNFVDETRPWDILPWAEKPMEVLVKWWGPDARKWKIWTDVLFRRPHSPAFGLQGRSGSGQGRYGVGDPAQGRMGPPTP
ncbi:hypothetical protein R1sor_025973 [Riccia sorocarpa]|uniref:Uncharacterized protein n=1 Tax=Riccia sorocarpa TaxID=122646 RepID=A0ABD3GD54_9MARC